MDLVIWFLLGVLTGIPFGLILNHLADYEHTATGYVFLDRVTLPYWRWRARRETAKFERLARARGVSPRKDP